MCLGRGEQKSQRKGLEEDLLAHGSWVPRREQSQSHQGCPPEVLGTGWRGQEDGGRCILVPIGCVLVSEPLTPGGWPRELQSRAKSLNPAGLRQTH